MIDSLDLETLMKVIPRCCFVGVNGCAFRNAGTNERGDLAFAIEYCRNGIAATFPNYHNNLALAVLVPGQAPITAMCFDVGRLHVAAKVPAINLSLFAFTADNTA